MYVPNGGARSVRTTDMPVGWGEDEQRFAAAVETADLTGLPLNAALRRDLHVVSILRGTGAALSPDAAESARMKARLFAAIEGQNTPREAARFDTAPSEADQVTERIATAGAVRGRHRSDGPELRPAVSTTPSDTPDDAAAEATPLQRARARRSESAHVSARRRFPIVGAAATLLLVAIASMAVLLSRDALPGSTLYGVKRATENVGLGLTFDTVDKANRHLDLAGTRMQEVAALLDSQQSEDTSALVEQALQDFAADTAAASRLLLGDVEGVDAAQLNGLRDWAVEKKASLGGLRSDLPAPSLANADGSMALLDRLRGRADALKTRLPCRELSSGLSDELGILPADGQCTPLPAGVAPPQARQAGEPAGLDPGALGLPDPTTIAPGVNGGTETKPSTSAAPSGVNLPVPGVDRITIPPLLPGLPDITIGG